MNLETQKLVNRVVSQLRVGCRRFSAFQMGCGDLEVMND